MEKRLTMELIKETKMKTILFILLLIFPLSINAQEKDSTFSHYGLIMDYDYAIGNAFGFKYRISTSTAFFIKGGFYSDENSSRLSTGTSVDKINVYGGDLGMEYTVLSIDNISFYAVISGGLNIHTSSHLWNNQNRRYKNIEYTIETGFGTEYFISRHLSIGGSQTISLNYFKDNLFDDHDKPLTTTHTKFTIVDTKLTLSFYF